VVYEARFADLSRSVSRHLPDCQRTFRSSATFLRPACGHWAQPSRLLQRYSPSSGNRTP